MAEPDAHEEARVRFASILRGKDHTPDKKFAGGRIRSRFAAQNAANGVEYDQWNAWICLSPEGEQWPVENKKQKKFLTGYAFWGTIPRACRYACITRRTLHDWQAIPEFAEYFEEARQMAIDRLEELAIKHAFKPKTRDSRILIRMLEAMRPQRYAPKTEVDIRAVPMETVRLIDGPAIALAEPAEGNGQA